MRRLLGFFVLMALWGGGLGQMRPLHGVVLDGRTVTLLKEVEIGYGNDTAVIGTTNDKGTFRVNLPANASVLSLRLPGYQTVKKTIRPGQRFSAIFLYPDGPPGTKGASLDSLPAVNAGAAPGHDLTVSVKAHLDETYEQVSENNFLSPGEYPLSSFILNADEASFCNVRRFVNNGLPPPSEAVRIEEMINYFSDQYPIDPASAPFYFRTDVATCPWNKDHWVMRLAGAARPLPADTVIPNNLVLLIDVSGSMEKANKLPLLKKAFDVLVNRLDSADRIAVIIYAGKVSVALPSTPGFEKHKILDVINNLNAGGSTAGEAGIELAFKTAKNNFLPGGNNRVIMATDGDFNVGHSSDEDMKKLVSKYHDWGIFLTCIGVGMGNYKDSKLETIARWGQGNFVYLDNSAEASRVFSGERFRQILIPEVRNAVFKVIFNPLLVKNYRLIGYENRTDVRGDSLSGDMPGGEIGYGQNIQAFYELEPAAAARTESRNVAGGENQAPPLATVALRYESLEDHREHLRIRNADHAVTAFEKTDPGFRYAAAVALFGMIMRQSAYAGEGNLDMVADIVRHIRDKDNKETRKSFLKLIQKAERIRRGMP